MPCSSILLPGGMRGGGTLFGCWLLVLGRFVTAPIKLVCSWKLLWLQNFASERSFRAVAPKEFCVCRIFLNSDRMERMVVILKLMMMIKKRWRMMMMMVTLKDGGAGSLCESPPPVKISFLHSSTNSFETAEEVAHPPTPPPIPGSLEYQGEVRP